MIDGKHRGKISVVECRIAKCIVQLEELDHTLEFYPKQFALLVQQNATPRTAALDQIHI